MAGITAGFDLDKYFMIFYPNMRKKNYCELWRSAGAGFE
jgi:hypothetical protein